VTNRSGTEAYFVRNLRISFTAACLFSLGLDQHIEDLALGVDGAPRISHPPIDFQVDFVKMPGRIRLSGGAFADARRSSARSGSPGGASYRIVRGRFPALSEEIFDVTKAECEPEIEPLVNDLRGEPIFGVAFVVLFGYPAFKAPARVRKEWTRQGKRRQCRLPNKAQKPAIGRGSKPPSGRTAWCRRWRVARAVTMPRAVFPRRR
jgi:hypothetical protein